jgi:hypothetical protein
MTCLPCRVLNGFYNISERTIHNLKELPKSRAFGYLSSDDLRNCAKSSLFILSSTCKSLSNTSSVRK